MDFYDLQNLIRDAKQNNLYNLFDPTFKMRTGVGLIKYVVSPEEEMRIDLISKATYGSVNYCDFLLDLNGIDNPLNIKSGDILIYTEYESLELYKVRIVDNTKAQATLLNANKSTKKDPNRQKYIENNYSLPPTFLDEPTAPVRVEQNQIIIGG